MLYEIDSIHGLRKKVNWTKEVLGGCKGKTQSMTLGAQTRANTLWTERLVTFPWEGG